MSSVYKFCGYSYKIKEFDKDTPTEMIVDYINRKQNIFSENKINLKTEDDLWDYLYSVKYDNKWLNKWAVIKDLKGNYGWVYLTDTSESCDDLDFNTTSEIVRDLANLLCNRISRPINWITEIKIFAFEWYNGCDNPFEF